uniref:Si:ch211-284o19.8 n=1 Tax=Amphilophus citrinellus TaxID=61819 RepID=A0A3Q0RZS8_AMPCI
SENLNSVEQMSASKETQHAPGSYVPSSSTYSYQGEQPPPYSGISSDTTPLISSSSFDDQTVRKGFVRKVFSIVAIQLLFTCTVVCVFTFSSVVKEEVQSHLWAYLSSFIIFLVVVIALNCCKSFSRQHPWNIVFVITVSFSFMMGTIASYHNTAAVIITMGATLVISITIMVFSVQVRPPGTILIKADQCRIFKANTDIKIQYNNFSHYLAIDCQLMMGMMSYRADPEDYVNAALRIYLDVALIFLFLLGRR